MSSKFKFIKELFKKKEEIVENNLVNAQANKGKGGDFPVWDEFWNLKDDQINQQSTDNNQVQSSEGLIKDPLQEQIKQKVLLIKEKLKKKKKQKRVEKRATNPEVYVDLGENGIHYLTQRQRRHFIMWPGKDLVNDPYWKTSTKSCCLNDYLVKRTQSSKRSIDKLLQMYLGVKRSIDQIIDDLNDEFEPIPFNIPDDIIIRANKALMNPYDKKHWWGIYELTMFSIELHNWLYLYTDKDTGVPRVPVEFFEKLYDSLGMCALAVQKECKQGDGKVLDLKKYLKESRKALMTKNLFGFGW